MTNQHPITPPPELIAHWASSMCGYYEAARWGADQELDACCEWLHSQSLIGGAVELRAARRPKPPSLKEQALEGLKKVGAFTLGQFEGCSDFNEFQIYVHNIRRALEQLDD